MNDNVFVIVLVGPAGQAGREPGNSAHGIGGTLYHFYNEGTEQNRVQLGVKYRKNHFFSSMQLSQKSFSEFAAYDLAAPRAAG